MGASVVTGAVEVSSVGVSFGARIRIRKISTMISTMGIRSFKRSRLFNPFRCRLRLLLWGTARGLEALEPGAALEEAALPESEPRETEASLALRLVRSGLPELENA